MGLDFRRLDDTGADAILDDLSSRQHLTPHTSLEMALNASQQKLGFCPNAGEEAVGWLRFDRQRAIGRLKRGEIIQLARSIHRFWEQGTARNLHTL